MTPRSRLIIIAIAVLAVAAVLLFTLVTPLRSALTSVLRQAGLTPASTGPGVLDAGRVQNLLNSYMDKVTISKTSSPESGTKVKKGDKIEYTLTIANDNDSILTPAALGGISDTTVIDTVTANAGTITDVELPPSISSAADAPTYRITGKNNNILVVSGLFLPENRDQVIKFTATVSKDGTLEDTDSKMSAPTNLSGLEQDALNSGETLANKNNAGFGENLPAVWNRAAVCTNLPTGHSSADDLELPDIIDPTTSPGAHFLGLEISEAYQVIPPPGIQESGAIEQPTLETQQLFPPDLREQGIQDSGAEGQFRAYWADNNLSESAPQFMQSEYNGTTVDWGSSTEPELFDYAYGFKKKAEGDDQYSGTRNFEFTTSAPQNSRILQGAYGIFAQGASLNQPVIYFTNEENYRINPALSGESGASTCLTLLKGYSGTDFASSYGTILRHQVDGEHAEFISYADSLAKKCPLTQYTPGQGVTPPLLQYQAGVTEIGGVDVAGLMGDLAEISDDWNDFVNGLADYGVTTHVATTEGQLFSGTASTAEINTCGTYQNDLRFSAVRPASGYFDPNNPPTPADFVAKLQDPPSNWKIEAAFGGVFSNVTGSCAAQAETTDVVWNGTGWAEDADFEIGQAVNFHMSVGNPSDNWMTGITLTNETDYISYLTNPHSGSPDVDFVLATPDGTLGAWTTRDNAGDDYTQITNYEDLFSVANDQASDTQTLTFNKYDRLPPHSTWYFTFYRTAKTVLPANTEITNTLTLQADDNISETDTATADINGGGGVIPPGTGSLLKDLTAEGAVKPDGWLYAPEDDIVFRLMLSDYAGTSISGLQDLFGIRESGSSAIGGDEYFTNDIQVSIVEDGTTIASHQGSQGGADSTAYYTATDGDGDGIKDTMSFFTPGHTDYQFVASGTHTLIIYLQRTVKSAATLKASDLTLPLVNMTNVWVASGLDSEGAFFTVNGTLPEGPGTVEPSTPGEVEPSTPGEVEPSEPYEIDDVEIDCSLSNFTRHPLIKPSVTPTVTPTGVVKPIEVTKKVKKLGDAEYLATIEDVSAGDTVVYQIILTNPDTIEQSFTLEDDLADVESLADVVSSKAIDSNAVSYSTTVSNSKLTSFLKVPAGGTATIELTVKLDATKIAQATDREMKNVMIAEGTPDPEVTVVNVKGAEDTDDGSTGGSSTGSGTSGSGSTSGKSSSTTAETGPAETATMLIVIYSSLAAVGAVLGYLLFKRI